jgi:hypothetical protein
MLPTPRFARNVAIHLNEVECSEYKKRGLALPLPGEKAVRKEVIEFIKHVVIDLLAAIIGSSLFFSGSSRLITGYWMRWFRTPYIYLWAFLVILILVWIMRKRSV